MKFQVTRTSDWANSAPPCEGATLAHRHVGDLDEDIYTIEIESLEDLVRFKEKVGKEIIITTPRRMHYISPLEIEIYDDYRE